MLIMLLRMRVKPVRAADRGPFECVMAAVLFTE